LAAARTLLNASEWTNSDDLSKALQVTMLESKDRLGGRVHSVDMMETAGAEAVAGDAAIVAVDLGGRISRLATASARVQRMADYFNRRNFHASRTRTGRVDDEGDDA
jgi:hypothetical protein